MIPPFIRGSIAPVFTAFNADGSLDDDGQRRFLDFLLDNGGISAYFLRCGMGQMFTFSYDDVRQIAQTACTHLAGKAPALIGTSGEWDRNREKLPDPDAFLKQGIELGRYAEDCGADGVVYTMPEAIPPRDGETPADVIFRYFEALCEALRGPIFIYQSPGTLEEYCVTIDLVRKLADLPKLKGMKASTNDAHYIFNISWALRDKDDYAFISGAETAFLSGLISGSKAVIGQGATLNPKILNAIQDRYEAGDLEGAIEAQRVTNLLVEECTNATEFFKRYATEKGYEVQPHSRGVGTTAYGQKPPLSQEEYDAYKKLYEAETAKFG
jgi:4-hydroxy-tetrahydrodipicolinate synthase